MKKDFSVKWNGMINFCLAGVIGLPSPLGKGDRLRWMRLFKTMQQLRISYAKRLIRQACACHLPQGEGLPTISVNPNLSLFRELTFPLLLC